MNYGYGMQGNGGVRGGATGSLFLPGFDGMGWADIELLAAGGTVNFWHWDGNPKQVDWVQNWLGTRLSSKYGIKLNLMAVNKRGTLDGVMEVEDGAKQMTGW
jgi:hypothetical protein